MPVVLTAAPVADATPFLQAQLDLLQNILLELKTHRLILNEGFRNELNREQITPEDVQGL